VSLARERCITCSDEAVEAQVVAVDRLTAVVRVEGREERVAVDLVPAAAPGDVLLCHAGIALEKLSNPGVRLKPDTSHQAPG
jgi:hydrogenase maturation factor